MTSLRTLRIVGLIVLLRAASASAQDVDKNASKVADAYLAAVKIAELPEGKQVLARVTWDWSGQSDYPSYSEVKTLFEGMFPTDTDNVFGYKRLVELRALTESGAISVKHYILIAYRDATSGVWKVLVFRGAEDLDHEALAAQPKPVGNNCVDASTVEHFAPVQLPDLAVPCQIEYKKYGYWSLLAGKINQAKEALQEASDLNKKYVSRPLDEPGVPAAEWPLDYFERDLKTIGSITGTEVNK
jgi:hypothetical protein